jgi:hypothetical protein
MRKPAPKQRPFGWDGAARDDLNTERRKGCLGIRELLGIGLVIPPRKSGERHIESLLKLCEYVESPICHAAVWRVW